jgi:hypothetical protein
VNKINWEFLSKNPNAIYMIEQNTHRINYNYLLHNLILHKKQKLLML